MLSSCLVLSLWQPSGSYPWILSVHLSRSSQLWHHEICQGQICTGNEQSHSTFYSALACKSALYSAPLWFFKDYLALKGRWTARWSLSLCLKESLVRFGSFFGFREARITLERWRWVRSFNQAWAVSCRGLLVAQWLPAFRQIILDGSSKDLIAGMLAQNWRLGIYPRYYWSNFEQVQLVLYHSCRLYCLAWGSKLVWYLLLKLIQRTRCPFEPFMTCSVLC